MLKINKPLVFEVENVDDYAMAFTIVKDVISDIFKTSIHHMSYKKIEFEIMNQFDNCYKRLMEENILNFTATINGAIVQVATIIKSKNYK